EEWRTMNATSAGVAFCAAKMRSPSFSRSSSSTTTTGRPSAISLTASSMVANCVIAAPTPDCSSLVSSVRHRKLLDVLGDDIDLEVDRRARTLAPQRGPLQRRRDQAHRERLVIDIDNRQRNAVDADR